MTQPLIEKWQAARALLQTLPEMRDGMNTAHTDRLQEAYTEQYVDQADQLVDLMIELERSGAMKSLEGFIEHCVKVRAKSNEEVRR